MKDLGYAALWERDLPSVTNWFSRMAGRDAYSATFYAGSRLSEQYPDIVLGSLACEDSRSQGWRG
jgi:hypothetical protein